MAGYWELQMLGNVMYEGRCRNHPECRYLTKGPGRSLFYTPENPATPECSCPLTDIEFSEEGK